jgi:shikimate O-hydroxycinnamoyltransferase
MQPIPLSPIDYIFTGVGSYPITFAFAYARSLDPAHVRGSLDETLAHFPLLRGKLIRVSDDAFAFSPDEDGLSFEVNQSGETFGDAGDLDRFVSPVASTQGQPLTRIKLTQTPAGSVLGVSISHALVDGFSYFHVLSSWARIAGGQRILEPAHQRAALLPEPPPQPDRITPEEILARCGLFRDERRRDLPHGPLGEERIPISKAQIRGLLLEAQETCDVALTNNDVISAFLWREYVPRWCERENNPLTYVTLPFDFRRALKSISRTFFGCALCFTTASLDYEGLVRARLGELALLVHEAVGRAKEDYIWGSLQTLDGLRRGRGLDVMQEIHVRHPRNGIVVTNISRLPFQALDFGAGVPTGFQAYTQVLGGAGLMPAQDGVEVRVFLPAEEQP